MDVSSRRVSSAEKEFIKISSDGTSRARSKGVAIFATR
jgi:hypothetical protein